MFDLEKSIADWRKRMLAAGIKSPAPLEELEIHLREEIERQMKSGLNEQEAFNSAVQKMGLAGALKSEFKKTGGFAEKLGENKTVRINRTLGLLWLIYCLGSFYHLTNGLMSDFSPVHITPLFIFAWLMEFVYLRGVIASVLLFGGVVRERRFILLLAILDAVGGVAVMLIKPFQPLSCAFTILGFVTIWLLWPSQKTKLTAN